MPDQQGGESTGSTAPGPWPADSSSADPPRAELLPYPSGTIRLVVPWAAGSATDRQARLLAELASRALGQPVQPVNHPGAGGTLGPGHVGLSAEPDGYTLAQYPLNMLRLPSMRKTSWDPLEHFTFIIGLTGYTFGLAVRADSRHQDLPALLTDARRRPNVLRCGSLGTGTSAHLMVEELAFKAGVRFTQVSIAERDGLIHALMAGDIDALADTAGGWRAPVERGQMRLLASFGEQRAVRFAEVPTAQELGFDVVAIAPTGIVGPKGLAPALVRQLHDALLQALDDPRHLALIAELDLQRWYRNSDDYTAWARATLRRQRALIERLGLLRTDEPNTEAPR